MVAQFASRAIRNVPFAAIRRSGYHCLIFALDLAHAERQCGTQHLGAGEVPEHE